MFIGSGDLYKIHDKILFEKEFFAMARLRSTLDSFSAQSQDFFKRKENVDMARISFRKSFRVGPFRSTLSHRGITNSVGAGGLRISESKPGFWQSFAFFFIAVLSAFLKRR